MLKSKKREETPAGKLIRAAAHRLLDMQFEAEVGARVGGTNGSEEIGKASDASFVITELAIEHAAHVASKRAARFEVRDMHHTMHKDVKSVVVELSTKLEDLDLASYPGGAEQARLDEVSGRIATCAMHADDISLPYLRETVTRANKMFAQLSPPFKNKLAGLVLTLQRRDQCGKTHKSGLVCDRQKNHVKDGGTTKTWFECANVGKALSWANETARLRDLGTGLIAYYQPHEPHAPRWKPNQFVENPTQQLALTLQSDAHTTPS